MFLGVVILVLVGIHHSYGWDDFELEALLAFKQNLVDSSSLSNWNRENSHLLCLNWEGVICNNATSHVEELEFGGLDEMGEPAGFGLKGPISQSIWNLRYLTTMNMCCNNFSGMIPPLNDSSSGWKSLRTLDLSYNSITSPLPRELEHLQNLMVLDLSNNELNEAFPPAILKLRNLKVLALSDNRISGNIPKEIGRMEGLTFLDLSSNNLTGRIEVLTNCSSLKSIFMESNLYLGGTLPRNIDIKLKDLEKLDLRRTSITGNIPLELGNCTKLLGIRTNSGMQGPIPLSLIGLPQLILLDLEGLDHGGLSLPLKELFNMSKLKVLNLGSSNATGSFPSLEGDVYPMQYLALDSNQLTGQLPELHKFAMVKVLILDTCSFSGPLPKSITQMHALQLLKLSNNNFTGKFPDVEEGSWQNLIGLNIQNNTFTGVFPSSLCQLPNLEELYMNNNNFMGTVPAAFESLGILDLSENMLSGNIHNLFKNCTNLEILRLQNNEFKGSFPQWLSKCIHLERIRMGGNRFAGKIKVDLEKLTGLKVLDLSNNNFEDEVPKIASGRNMIMLDLSGNRFSGRIPAFISEFSNLRLLRLGENKFSGTIPEWLWKTLENLEVLDLSGNNSMGTLPSGNILQGFKTSKPLPSDSFFMIIHYRTFECSEYTKVNSMVLCFIEISAIGSRDETKFYRERNPSTLYEEVSIQVKGNKLHYTYVPGSTTLLDLSSNMLTGVIPASLCDLVGLRYLTLSHNNISGKIPDCIADIQKLEQLDLSYNNITGQIPETLKNLHSLAVFNVSYNQLEGKIPWEGQLSTFNNESSYEGNPGLCGRPLPNECNSGNSSLSGGSKELDHERTFGAWLHYVSPYGFAIGCLLGLALGFVATVTFPGSLPRGNGALALDRSKVSSTSMNSWSSVLCGKAQMSDSNIVIPPM